MNTVSFTIDNCCDCPYHYTEKIYTPDPWDHEIGVYCSQVVDKNSYNKKNKLVASDDYDIRKYSKIPDWCPNKNK